MKARTDCRPPLRIGLMGFGSVAQVHLSAYSLDTGLSVVAVADTSAERLALAKNIAGVNAYPTVDEVLEKESLDVACILTPAAAHEAVTLKCAKAGVNVLCEKPMALSIESCERMIAVCESHSVKFCYGASYRHLPAMVRARELIQSGEIGEVLLLREQTIGGTGPEHRVTLGMTHYPKGGPGGSAMGLVDHGIHLIDSFSWLMGADTRTAWGRGNISGERARPEFAVIEYSNGAFGMLAYDDGTFATELPNEGAFSWGESWQVDGTRVSSGAWSAQPGCIHVHGTLGALRIFYYANRLYLCNAEGARQIRVSGEAMPANFLVQLTKFADAIRDGAALPATAADGLAAVRTLLEIYGLSP